jgi:myosin V
MDDLTMMPILTESTILQSICDRYARDMIYTYCGKVLIAMNPWKLLHIYTDGHSLAYQGAKIKDMPPHCFAIADIAYRSMITDHADQSILVSGESGAGKTETAKFLLQHLASLSNHAAATGTFSPHLRLDNNMSYTTQLHANHDAHSLEQRILASNPILEAFGNARTVRNPNSSRYGKFIQLLFDSPTNDSPRHRKVLPRLVGASIEIFLLERSRVVHIAPGEGNYHIFSQLRSAAADARSGGSTAPARDASGGALRVLLAERVATEGVRILGEAGAEGGALRAEDLAGFERTVAAMRGVGLAEAEVVGALETVAVRAHESCRPAGPSRLLALFRALP